MMKCDFRLGQVCATLGLETLGGTYWAGCRKQGWLVVERFDVADSLGERQRYQCGNRYEF